MIVHFPQDFESVFKCVPDSEDSDHVNTSSKCFTVNPRHIFKRKHAAPTSTRSCTAPLSPTTPASPPIKHWFRPDASSASNMMMTSTPEQRPATPQFDPTYGFAAYAQSQPGDYYQDILYPLRSSTSNSSSLNQDAENVPKKKRVKFNTVVSSAARPTTRPFNIPPTTSVPYLASAAPSLKTRIVDFFANLF